MCKQCWDGGGCACDAFWDPRRWSKSYCRARLEPRRARPPLPLQDIKQSHFKASQQITETPPFGHRPPTSFALPPSRAARPWLEAGFPPPGAWAACGISGKHCLLPPSSPALANHSQHPPSQPPQHPPALPCLLGRCSPLRGGKGRAG